MKFTEEKLERAFTELLGNENFPHHLGITIKRAPDEVLIEEDLQNFLLTQYSNHGNHFIGSIKGIAGSSMPDLKQIGEADNILELEG